MIIKDELLLTVDESNNPIEPKPRNEVHTKGYWHRTTHVWVFNKKKQILCQRRSLLKDMNPGKWEAFFGGHIAPKQEYLDSAFQEINEELGITVPRNHFTFLQIHKCDSEKEFQAIYYVEWNGSLEELQLEKEEVDQVKWVEISELTELLIKKKNINWTKWGYEKNILQKISAHLIAIIDDMS